MNEEMNSKKSNVGIIYIVIIVLLLAVIGVLVFKQLDGKKEDTNNTENAQTNNIENTQTNNKQEDVNITPISYVSKCDEVNTWGKKDGNTVDIDTSKYSNIFDYIMKQDNLKVTYNYCGKVAGGSLKLEDGDYDVLATVLTTDEVNSFMNSGKTSAVSYSYSDGIGGVCVNNIDIQYTRSGKNYTVKLVGYKYLETDDGNVYKIIDDKLGTPDAASCRYNINIPYIETLKEVYK